MVHNYVQKVWHGQTPPLIYNFLSLDATLNTYCNILGGWDACKWNPELSEDGVMYIFH